MSHQGRVFRSDCREAALRVRLCIHDVSAIFIGDARTYMGIPITSKHRCRTASRIDIRRVCSGDASEVGPYINAEQAYI